MPAPPDSHYRNSDPPHDARYREFHEQAALVREVAVRLSAALDVELQAQSERARAGVPHTTLTEVDAELDALTARMAEIQTRMNERFAAVQRTMQEVGIEGLQRLGVELEDLEDQGERLAAEIIELKAVRAEFQRPR